MERHHPTDLKANKLNNATRKALQELMKEKIDDFLVSVENQKEREKDLETKIIQTHRILKREEKSILHLEKNVKMLEENLNIIEGDNSVIKTKLNSYESQLQEENDFLSNHEISMKIHEKEYWDKIKELDKVLQQNLKIENIINDISDKMLKESMMLKEYEEQQTLGEGRVFQLEAEMEEIETQLLTSEIRNERLINHLESLDQKIESASQRCNESENMADEHEEKTKQLESLIEKLNEDLQSVKVHYEQKQDEIVEAKRKADLADMKMKTARIVIRLCHKAQNIVKKRR